MNEVGLMMTVKSKPGKEDEVAALLRDTLPLAKKEPTTPAWLAIKMDGSTFGILHVFPDEGARQAHLNGPVSAHLTEKTAELFDTTPELTPVDVLAAKLPGQQ